MKKHTVAIVILMIGIILGCNQSTNMKETEIREQNMSAVSNFFAFMHQKKLDQWDSLWNDDGFIYIPYPVAGFPDTIKSRQTISEGFRTLFSNFQSFDYKIANIYPSVDPNVIVVEYTVSAHIISTGATYNGTNIAVFKFRDGKISAYHDYFNPEKFKMVVDALPK